jgi:acyl-CoA thioester hydrolase
MTHLYYFRVYYEDTDAGGVVYHANYLRFAERARTEALRDAGVPHAEMAEQHGLIFMVRRTNLDYLAPGRLDDALVVATRCVALGAATVELEQTVRHCDGLVLVVCRLQLACLRAADFRPKRIPPRWRSALRHMIDVNLP